MSNKHKVPPNGGAVRFDDYGGDHCAWPPALYLEVLDALVWGLSTAAGKATPQAQELIKLLRELAK